MIVKGHKGFVSVPLGQRFWEKVQKGDGCWPWTGKTNRGGYASIWAGNRHRSIAQVAWEMANGQPFPEGMNACHTCDNPSCVRPDHIFPGTDSDNMQDAFRKGRLPQSERRSECPSGHPYSGENLYVVHGERRCRTCQSNRDKGRWRG